MGPVGPTRAMDERGGLRARTLLTVALVAAALTNAGLTLWARAQGSTPPPSWAAGLLLGAFAAALVVAGRRIRATRRGTAPRPVHPIAAYRVLLLSQASALTGALVVGAYAVVCARTLPDLAAASARVDLVSGVVTVLGGAALVAAGLWVQRVCRIDPPEGDPSETVGPLRPGEPERGR